MSWLSRRKKKRAKKKIMALPRFERGPALFRFHYPMYECGVGSYGLPTVRDWKEGSTLKIGAYCSIADEVTILLGGHHRIDWITTFPFPALIPEAEHIGHYNGTHGDVVIENDVWICFGATVLSGVTIGNGAVVAANSVVTKDVPPYAVVAGNPAQFIKWRFPDEIRTLLLEAQWWLWPVEEVRAVVEFLCSDDIQSFIHYLRARHALNES